MMAGFVQQLQTSCPSVAHQSKAVMGELDTFKKLVGQDLKGWKAHVLGDNTADAPVPAAASPGPRPLNLRAAPTLDGRTQPLDIDPAVATAPAVANEPMTAEQLLHKLLLQTAAQQATGGKAGQSQETAATTFKACCNFRHAGSAIKCSWVSYARPSKGDAEQSRNSHQWRASDFLQKDERASYHISKVGTEADPNLQFLFNVEATETPDKKAEGYSAEKPVAGVVYCAKHFRTSKMAEVSCS